MTAAFLMIVSNCLGLREAYSAIEVRVLLVIIGTMALGAALQKTGAADLYAHTFLSMFRGGSPSLILTSFIVLTSVLSHFLSNNSTAVLMVPLGISTAQALGVSVQPFIIGICFGASACFASPLGYQTNLLIYEPGGYSFADYLKLGMPLNILVWTMSSLLIPVIWQF
jgi:di/tricarboxylate transporter